MMKLSYPQHVRLIPHQMQSTKHSHPKTKIQPQTHLDRHCSMHDGNLMKGCPLDKYLKCMCFRNCLLLLLLSKHIQHWYLLLPIPIQVDQLQFYRYQNLVLHQLILMIHLMVQQQKKEQLTEQKSSGELGIGLVSSMGSYDSY